MTKKYRTDSNGRWEIKEGYETLVEPSKEYLAEIEKERLKRDAEKKLEDKKRERIEKIKEKLGNKTATSAEIQEVLETLI